MTDPGGTDRPAFDPRHDARFQRGYRPGDDDGAAPVRRSRGAAPPAAVAPPTAVAPAPFVPRAEADPVPGGIDPQPTDDLDDFDTLVFDADGFEDELEPSRWNPFIALLWLVVVVFVGGAVALQVQAATLSYSNIFYDGNGPVPIEMLIQQLSYSIASPVLIAGLVTLAGLLFWHAWTWRARRVAPRG